MTGKHADGKDSFPRVGFVVDWLNDSYQLEVLRGAARAADRAGAQLIILPGGVLGADHDHGACRNGLYSLISEERLDGLVVMTGTLGNARGTDVMEEIAPQYPKKRVCHIALSSPGSPSVLIDNKSGMRKMIEHLVLIHRCRKIAFIRGPESNSEAETRYQAYREVLEVFDIPFDEMLVAPGNFLREAGTAAVKTFFDDRGLGVTDIDAIVAADDLMALAAMEELGARGIRVPSDIAVVGFDDVEEAQFSLPPLSTVHQPLEAQGSVAVRTVLAGDTSAPPLLETPCRFRRSCGCTAEDPGALTARPKSDTRMSLRDSVIRRRGHIAAEIRGELDDDSAFPADWADVLVGAILETLEGKEEAFREAFDVLLERLLLNRQDASTGHAVASALRRQLSVCAGDDPAQIRRVEGLLHEARILTSNAVGRSEAQRRLRLEKEAAELSRVSMEIASSVRPIEEILATALPRLGIRSCALLEIGEAKEAKIIFRLTDGAFDAGEESPSPLQGIDGAALLSEVGRRNLLLEPLDDGTQLKGLFVVPYDEVRPYLVEVIRDLLNVALRRRSG